MTISLRLRTAMNSAGIPSQSALARLSGVPQPTINRILHRTGRHGPATDTLGKLAVACGVSFQWLANGTDVEQDAVDSQQRAKGLPEPGSESPMVGLKSGHAGNTVQPVQIRQVRLDAQAGAMASGFVADEKAQEGVFLGRDWPRRRGYDARSLVAFPITGDSMVPGLYPGDTVVVNLADAKPHDGEVFAVNYDGTVLIRRLARDAKTWWLCSDSTDQARFRRKQYTGAYCTIIGRVVYKLSEKI
jgi:phage repressor protein C with HTH and peptisase S24 domain